jgi:hypothetical protein
VYVNFRYLFRRAPTIEGDRKQIYLKPQEFFDILNESKSQLFWPESHLAPSLCVPELERLRKSRRLCFFLVVTAAASGEWSATYQCYGPVGNMNVFLDFPVGFPSDPQ